MPIDLIDAAADIAAGRTRAGALLDAALAAADRLGPSFVRRFDAQARAAAAAVDAQFAAGAPLPPLAGLAVSVKDLFDVAGQPTTAGSASLADAAPAAADAPAVARLRAAGAALVGHTNLTEFAYSGIGINRHLGTPPNVAAASLDAVPRIPGGSTSGGASSVAGGAAWAALGSDTGGSIRIPAALQGLVGFKSTARLVPTAGCVPLSTTLDTACAITRSVRDAVRVHEVLAARRVAHTARPIGAWRFAVPQTRMLDGLEPAVAAAFEAALRALSAAGARVDTVPMAQIAGIEPLLRGGGLTAAESWAWHRARLAHREAGYDPRVVRRIRMGEALSAADYLDLLRGRAAWIAAMEAATAPWDALLSPTVPMLAPPLGPLLDDDEAFFAANAALLRNPMTVNLLDGCALSLPCHAPGALPVGLMVWAPALADDRVLEAALRIEAVLGATLMRVAVIGAGIVGVTTAYELVADGHEVTVFERRGSVAAETSFANAGIVAPGYVTPWAAPGMPGKVLAQWFARHAAVRVGPRIGPATLAWLWRWWRACGTKTWQANRARMQRLAFHSRMRLREIVRARRLEYERSEGVLVLLRGPRELAQVQRALPLLDAAGVRFRLVDPAQCRAIEPWLDAEQPLHAGLHLPDDEVGNCRQFAHLIRHEAQSLGAEFRFHSEVRRLVPGHPAGLTYVHTPPPDSTLLERDAGDAHSTLPQPTGPQTEAFDAVVVCAATHSAPLLRAAGLALPLLAVHGYSITAPLRDDPQHPGRGPLSALMDERYKVAISRLGNRVRVAGAAEIGHAATREHPAAIETLYKVLHDWFPGAARLGQVQRWKGARPMLPDGPPVLGTSGLDGIWLNLGHGSSGWALACGSARIVADRIAGREPGIDCEGFGIERLRR